VAHFKNVFLESLPVTATSFVNKCGDIGIRVLPMLLVEQAVSTQHSSIIMALVKSMSVFAAVAGGVLGDRVGHRNALLVSFGLSALAMFGLMGAQGEVLICVAAMLCTFGQGIFAAPLRLLMVQSVSVANRKESLAWLRSANNGAVFTANLVAALTAGIGLRALFAFDAVTSVAALVLGLRWLPRVKPSELIESNSVPSESTSTPWIPFILACLLPAIFTGNAELFFVSAAAQAKINFGAQGIAVFSKVYMINTVLCMLLTVIATRIFVNTLMALSCGFLLQSAGVIWFWFHRETTADFFIATFLQTFGELSFTAVSQFLILKILPSGNQGRTYSVALVIQMLGKMLGAAVAFYFVRAPVEAAVSIWPIALAIQCVFALGIAFVLTRLIAKRAESVHRTQSSSTP
jgi:MFS family permease